MESEGQWLKAGDLRPGMALRTAHGTTSKVTGVRSYTERQRTHDLTINDTNTYYVLEIFNG